MTFHAIMIMFSYLLRGVHSYAQAKDDIHSPTRHTALGVSCIGVCAWWMEVRERASSPGMPIDKRLFVGSALIVMIYLMFSGAMEELLIYSH